MQPAGRPGLPPAVRGELIEPDVWWLPGGLVLLLWSDVPDHLCGRGAPPGHRGGEQQANSRVVGQPLAKEQD